MSIFSHLSPFASRTLNPYLKEKKLSPALFENANIQCLFLFCSYFLQRISKHLNLKLYLWEMKIFLLFIFQTTKLTQKNSPGTRWKAH